jgi:N-acetylglutamate synthase-like GNAT family acetyltransferase
MAFLLRRASQADEPAIKALVRAANLNPFGLDWPRFLVAEDAGRVIGIGQIKVHGDGSRELASLATVPERQGEGIATAIIRALLEAETAAPSPAYGSTLYLMCRSHMAPFYARFGFGPAKLEADTPHYFRRLMRLIAALTAVGRLVGIPARGLIMVRKGV